MDTHLFSPSSLADVVNKTNPESPMLSNVILHVKGGGPCLWFDYVAVGEDR